MSTKFVKATIVLVLLSIVVNAQTPILITGTKLTYPILSKWIAEYSKENPQVQILLVNKNNTEGKKIDISIIAHQPSTTELQINKQIIPVNKYALLPVASNSNLYIKKHKNSGFNKKELEKLFFDESIFEESKEKTKSPVIVYARESQSCSSKALADYFGRQSNEIRGKKIAGDDIYLLSSIKKDSLGVAFVNLNYIYDNNSRKLKDGFTILPLDISKEETDYLTNIDDVIYILEKTKIETIPVSEISFVLDNTAQNAEVLKFISWVINNGQEYNHQFGFLNLDKETQKAQSSKLNESILTAVK